MRRPMLLCGEWTRGRVVFFPRHTSSQLPPQHVISSFGCIFLLSSSSLVPVSLPTLTFILILSVSISFSRILTTMTSSAGGSRIPTAQAISSLKSLAERISEVPSLLPAPDKFGSDDDTDSPYERAKTIVEHILSETCNIVRSTGPASSAELEPVIALADEILNEVVNEVYGDWELHDFIPSFAQTKEGGDAPLLKDSEGEGAVITGLSE